MSDSDIHLATALTPGTEMKVQGGGSHRLGFDVLHDCSECGNAVNQVIAGLA